MSTQYDPIAARSDRFGIEPLAFAQLMPFCPGVALTLVWGCEESADPVASLADAQFFLRRARESRVSAALVGHQSALHLLYFAHIHPRVEFDWMAKVLGDILFEDWESALPAIERRREFFVANGGRA